MELPHSGTVPLAGTWSFRNARVWRPASSRVSVEASIGGQQPRAGVHLPDHRLHGRELLGAGVDDQVGAFGDHGQVVVGDQGGDLHDDVAGRVEPGHLEVHPYEHPGDAIGGPQSASGPGFGRRAGRHGR